jgi:2'-hydroxyisoflavone reductase
MRILILGGTVFLGRALVEAALAKGHTLTLFNRGKSNPGLYPQVEQIHGDRSVDLSALQGRRWDVAIDTSGYVPRVVGNTARALTEAVEHYTFVSTLSVYASPQAGTGENGALAKLKDEHTEEVNGETYGALKALCEEAAEQALPGRVFIPRPGLIVGPYDSTDRFTYWPHRLAQGGEVLAPGRPERRIQFIDVRDLAEWMLRMVEARQSGIYNAVGPEPAVTMGELLETSRTTGASDAALTWVSEDFLARQHVTPWSELPAWVPESDPETAGFFGFDNRKAVAAGLTFRPLAETVRATLEWDRTRPAEHAWKAGLSRAREAELLAAWHAE